MGCSLLKAFVAMELGKLESVPPSSHTTSTLSLPTLLTTPQKVPETVLELVDRTVAHRDPALEEKNLPPKFKLSIVDTKFGPGSKFP